jgi:hypothetical protein
MHCQWLSHAPRGATAASKKYSLHPVSPTFVDAQLSRMIPFVVEFAVYMLISQANVLHELAPRTAEERDGGEVVHCPICYISNSSVRDRESQNGSRLELRS